jgi:hypothetical protein
MSGSTRQRGSRGRYTRSQPPISETPEDLGDNQAQHGDENASPQREDDASSSSTPDTSQRERSERVKQGKRPLRRDDGEAPSSHPQLDSSTVSAGMDAQLQAQLARITELEQRLSKQTELAKASARVAQLQEELGSSPVQVREDTRESIEGVGARRARRPLADAARPSAGPSADTGRAATNISEESRQAPTRGSTSVASEGRRKRRRSPSEDTLSEEDSSKRRRHRGMKPKEPSVYAAKNLREHNEWLLDVENIFTIMHYEYRHDAAKVAYAQQFLRGDHRATWNRHLATLDEDPTFDEFCEHLLDQLQNPVLRTYSTVRRFNAAQQRKDQSVTSFVTHLDTLEAQMMPYTDDQRRMHLLTKLRPELQQAILQHSEVPTTRDGLITLAIRLEDVKKMGTQLDLAEKEKAKAAGSKPETGSRAESSPKGGTSASKNDGTPQCKGRGRGAGESTSGSKPAKPNADRFEKKWDLSQRICFNCGKKGHLANICPEPKKALGPS